MGDDTALTKAMGEFEDREDAYAAVVATNEAVEVEGADEADFSWEGGAGAGAGGAPGGLVTGGSSTPNEPSELQPEGDIGSGTVVSQDAKGGDEPDEEEEEEEEGGTTFEYMLSFIKYDMDFFSEWR